MRQSYKIRFYWKYTEIKQWTETKTQQALLYHRQHKRTIHVRLNYGMNITSFCNKDGGLLNFDILKNHKH